MSNTPSFIRDTAFAEVIESDLNRFSAQCWEWDTMPTFGSLVCVADGQGTIFGIVSNIKTGSMDPMRYPFPYQKTEEELRAQHPQIFEFLKTVFEVTLVGYQVPTGPITYSLPPQPAKIHRFVAPVPPAALKHFFAAPDFLPLLFGSTATPHHMDELLLAILAFLSQQGLLSPDLFERYYHTFSLLTGNDYRRLKLLMQRVTTQHAKQLVHAI